MSVWCRLHARLLGLVRLHGGAWPEFVTLSPRWKAHHSVDVGNREERANSFTNLSIWARLEVEAKGCEECGPRLLAANALLEAFENGCSKVSL